MKKLNWSRTEELQVLKMLAYVVYAEEGLGQFELWERVKTLCPTIFELTTGEKLELETICQRTLEQQGLEITRSKLHQRADKADRYFEFNEMLEPVESAYKAIVKGPLVA